MDALAPSTIESVDEAAERLVGLLRARQATKPESLRDGVYFDLDAETYHADSALGSTDVKTLAYSPCDYWFSSTLNPDREPETSTSSQAFGSAIHKLVLEGRQAFEGAYAPTLHNGSTKAGKAELAAIEEAGRLPLKNAEFRRILVAGETIRRNEQVGEAFSGGMSEVSIFWTADGIRRKCRIDYLKTRASVDLKSIRNSRNVDFPAACRWAISSYRYDVQAEHYRQGRAAMADLVNDGAVHGDHDPAWLKRAAAAANTAFVFVFYQAEGAPLTWGCTISPASPILDIARTTIAQAEANFRSFMERFGPERPWLSSEPLAELELADMPGRYGRT